jgi:hypothetical protein
MAKTDYKSQNAQMGAIPLVKQFFGATMAEMKDLPVVDRNQLASAIARAEGFEQSELSFELVQY